MNGVVGAFVRVVEFEPLAQGVRGYADNCVRLGIETFWAAESLHRNAIFLDLIRLASKILFGHVLQETLQVRCFTENS